MTPVAARESASRTIAAWLAAMVVALTLNFAWEMLQSPLYNERMSTRLCFRAALGDAVLVLLVFLAAALVMRRWTWLRGPGARGYAAVLGAGLVIGSIVEWTSVHVLARWSYGPRMLVVPFVEIGVLPLLQMLVVPSLSAAIAGFLLDRKS